MNARFPGEVVCQGPHYPVLAWHAAPAGRSADRPCLVLAPGGGHLARVFYGHPGAVAEDFLAHWLVEAGFEVVALSYAANHPAVAAASTEMTIREWAEDFAAATQAIAGARAQGAVLVGWSMAGRLARPYRAAMEALGLGCDRFIGLAATPPLPNLTSPRPDGEPLTALGFWDSETRDARWQQSILARRQPSGRLPIDLDAYGRHYRCDNPVRLRGEPRAAPVALEAAALFAETGPFDYSGYPLCGAVIPTSSNDARHALTDAVSWGFLNAQMIYLEADHRLPGGLRALGGDEWTALCELVDRLPMGLTRRISGDHFFFIGEEGARACAAHIADLLVAMAPVRAWRRAISPQAKGDPS